MNAYFEMAVFQGLETKSIVKILGVFGVNGKGEYVAEIATAFNFLRRNSNLRTCD